MRHTPVAFDDCIGPDGRVRLRSYLPSAASTWLIAGCCGLRGCRRTVPIAIREAIQIMGSAEATVGELEGRLRCAACGGREVRVQITTDPRPAEARRPEKPSLEGRARLDGGHDAIPCLPGGTAGLWAALSGDWLGRVR